jgi:hypothetical protein
VDSSGAVLSGIAAVRERLDSGSPPAFGHIRACARSMKVSPGFDTKVALRTIQRDY